ncbi:zinc ribbon domain-containing protein [Bifidobacterium callimiconis]|uniref:zinc ribbon domain-containing protein n=1 Tax=Bifidobacterium callimiconis TaxID=2306973 RepID=UPI001BDD167C|nr:zinc ribbon domain-containing protein [Bifidobacterium callimiconis]MBT1176754.1 zinc ribbon domain-containing protein [Bifidobacterium callimiconis]
MKCGNCGAACEDGDVFCPSCGAPVETPKKKAEPKPKQQEPKAAPNPASAPQTAPADEATQVMNPTGLRADAGTHTPSTCPVCGRALDPDEAFCSGCGARIPGVVAPEVPPAQSAPNGPMQGPGPMPFPGNVPGQPGMPNGQPGMTAAVKKKIPPLTIALIAALIVVVLFAAVALFGGKGNSSSGTAGTTASDQGTSSSSSSSSGGSSTCSTAPKATVATVDTMNDYLVTTVHFSSSCSGSSKDVFGSNNTEIKISDSDGLVASAVFDFSSDPVDISSSSAQARLAFATNQYWRVPEQIDATDLTVTVSTATAADGSASSPANGVMAGANAMGNDDRESAAHQALEDQISHDKSAASGFYYTYTTQLSSKRLDLDAEGKVWSYQDIWAEFLGFKSRYPNALLIWSNDYPTYTKKGPSEYYVTLSGESFSSTDDATGWCSANGYDSDHCLPVDLS